MLKVINIEELQPGMFVTQVTKQQGVYRVTSGGIIKDEAAINNLIQKGISQLEIDLDRSVLDKTADTAQPLDKTNEQGLTYAQQLEQALEVYSQVKTLHDKLIRQISSGRVANFDTVNQVSQQLVEKVFESEDAIGVVTLFNQKDLYFLEHSVNCAILMIVFARHLGFDEKLMQQLGAGALLMDVGMAKLPLLLTEKPEGFNQADSEKMRSHVDMALDMIKNVEIIADTSRDVIAMHHERLDGSGYPRGLQGDDISVYGRMAAIVDVYDALTSSRPYREAYSPAAALRFMSEELKGFDQDLLAQFISCIGDYPIGSLVKLASNQLAIVMRLNKQTPLKPLVIAFYNLVTREYGNVSQIDLSQVQDDIVGSVDPADFALNLNQFLRQNLLAGR